MKMSRIIFIILSILGLTVCGAEIISIEKDTTLTVTVGNVYRLGRDQMIFDTSDYGRHRLSGMIVKMRIDGNENSGFVEYRFYDFGKYAKNDIRDSVTFLRNGFKHQMYIENLSGDMQKEVCELRKNAAKLLLYEGQSEDTEYSHRHSSWQISKEGLDIEQEPWKGFYINALKLQKL